MCETAGRGIGDQDVLRHYSDIKQSNIASLPFDLVDLVIRAQPKVFICENVPAFASRGAEVFRRVLRAALQPGPQFPHGRRQDEDRHDIPLRLAADPPRG